MGQAALPMWTHMSAMQCVAKNRENVIIISLSPLVTSSIVLFLSQTIQNLKVINLQLGRNK